MTLLYNINFMTSTLFLKKLEIFLSKEKRRVVPPIIKNNNNIDFCCDNIIIITHKINNCNKKRDSFESLIGVTSYLYKK